MTSICVPVLLLICLFTVESAFGQCTNTNKNGVTEDLATATYGLQTFYSPNYETSYFSSMDCRWRFSASSGKVVIDVRKYYIEGSPTCNYDFMEFYDGGSVMSSEPTVYCNVNEQGVMLVTSGQQGLIRLKSDFSVNYRGFTLRYLLGVPLLGAADCTAPITLTANSAAQYFTSSSWPDAYDRAESCTWSITPATTNYGIQMEVIFMDLLAGEECYSDVLTIYDGTTSAVNSVPLCFERQQFPPPPLERLMFTSSGPQITVIYTARRSGTTRRGFVISYAEVNIGLPTVPTTPATTVSQTSTCSSSTVTLTATTTTQYISSPAYPVFYAANQNCKWLISAPTGDVVQLKVVDSFLEMGEECVLGDTVVIYDGSTTEHPVLTTFCGEVSSDVNSTSKDMLIVFTSDAYYQERGFLVEFVSSGSSTPSCVDPSVQIENLNATTTPQYFTSPNYPDNYNSSLLFYWLIRNPNDTGVIKLETMDSRLEASPTCLYDHVTIYKGPCTTYPVLKKFCSDDTPTVTQDKGSYVLVVLTTDVNTEFRGFRIKYYVTEADTESSSRTLFILGLVLGVVIGVIVLAAIIVAIIWAIKGCRSPGGSSDIPHKRHRGDSVSLDSDDEETASTKAPTTRPGTSKGRLKHKQLPPLGKSEVKPPPVDAFARKMNILPSIKKV